MAIAIARNAGLGQFDRSLFTDDAVWWMQGRGELPIDAFGARVAAFSAERLGTRRSMKIHGTTAEQDRVAVEAECVVELRDGGTYNSTYHFLFRLRDGRACHVKEYFDTLRARDAFRKDEN